jgi:hypothetical protein
MVIEGEGLVVREAGICRGIQAGRAPRYDLNATHPQIAANTDLARRPIASRRSPQARGTQAK